VCGGILCIRAEHHRHKQRQVALANGVSYVEES